MSYETLIRVTTEGSRRLIGFSASDLNEIETSRRIAEEISALLVDLSSQGDCRLHIDFGNIDRITSAGLNGLIGINSHARSHGVRLVLVDVNSVVRDVFTMTRLERLFDFTVSTDAMPV